jgi:plastocyanin
MGPLGRGETRRRQGRWLLLLTALTLGALQLPSVGAADETAVEPAETPSGFAWKPSLVTSIPGGSVAFRNPGNVVPHGVHWTGGPEKPSCGGVPVDSFGTSWSGSCTFAQAGTYTFVCTVHPEEMRGTITVGSGETAPAPPSAPGQPPAAPDGPAAEALRLSANQHGAAVRGSISVSSLAIGGHLVLELRAKRASLGGRSPGLARVGGINRPLSSAGRLSFAAPLEPAARSALRRLGRLSMTVKIVVTPPSGPATTMTKGVQLHD